MAVQLTDDTWWINECYEEDDRHKHVSVYLVRENDRYLVVDTGSFYHRDEVLAQISKLTGERGIDAIVLSHSDYPHSGNVGPIREEWDDVTVYASSGAPAAQGLPPTAVRCRIGDSMEILDRQFSFIDPPLADRSHTTWIYDHSSGVLFTADGFGSYHTGNDCDATFGDLPDGIDYEAIHEYHADALVWLQYVDPLKLRATLDQIFEDYSVSYVVPVHGHPIAGSDLNEYLDRLVRGAAQIADEHTVGGDRP